MNFLTKKTEWIIFIILLFCIFKWGGYNNKFILGDGKAYYSYLTATIIYQDFQLNFIEDYESKYYNGNNGDFRRDIGNGKKVIPTYMGVAILWLPFFLIAHCLSLISNFPADGYSLLYQFSLPVAAAFYLFFGLKALRKLLQSFNITNKTIAFILVIFVFATPLYHLTVNDASFTHVYSFSLIAGFLFVVRRLVKSYHPKYIYAAFVLISFIALIRPVNLLIIASLPFLAGNRTTLKKRIIDIFHDYKTLIFSSIAALAIVSIQLIYYYLQVGEFIVYSYGDKTFNFADPHMFDILFSYKKGFFVYTPIAFFALLGFIKLFRENVFQAISLLLFFVLVVYVLSSWWAWWYGMSFGNRAFIEYLPYFAILLGLAFQLKLFPCFKCLLIFISFMAITLNLIQTYQYKHYILYWDMNKEYYWRVFLHTGKRYKGMLWEENKPADKKPVLKEKIGKKVFTYEQNFEKDTFQIKKILSEKFARSGQRSARLLPPQKYTPAFVRPVSSITDTKFVYVKAGGWVYSEYAPQKNPYALIVSVQNKKFSTYLSENSNNKNFVPGQWNKLELFAKTNFLKTSKDTFKIYLMNNGKKEIFVDDFKIEFYEPKDKKEKQVQN